MPSVVVSILLSILALSLLIAWHEFGHYLVARLTGMRVLQFSIGFGPKIVGFTRNGIEYRIGLLPIGGYVQIAGMSDLEEGAAEDPRAFINRPFWPKILTIAAGPLFNYFLAFVLFFVVFFSWSSQTTPRMVLGFVTPDAPAQAAGLKDGDNLLKIDGISVEGTRDFLSRIQKSQGHALAFEVQRGDQNLNLSVVPKLDPKSETYKIGVGNYRPVSLSFGAALVESASNLWSQSTGILVLLGQSIFVNPSTSGLGGPVQIVRELSSASSRGIGDFLSMMAGLSVVLGLFNILPIPALDGSKIFFLLIEGITRRKIPSKAQLIIHLVGIIAILGLMILLTVGDVLKIYSGS
jgi:regulator of sigma E protease